MIKCDADLLLIQKPWGFEFEFFDNQNISIWVVCIGTEHKSGYLLEDHSTSYHMHTSKEVLVLPLAGCISLTTPLQTNLIYPGQFLTLRPRTPHRLSPHLGCCILLEIELPSNRDDIIRISDSYGRTQNTYSWDICRDLNQLSWRSELREDNDTFNIEISGPTQRRSLNVESSIFVSPITLCNGHIPDFCDESMFVVTKGTATTSTVSSLNIAGDIISGKLLKQMLFNPNSEFQLSSPSLDLLHISGIKHQAP